MNTNAAITRMPASARETQLSAPTNRPRRPFGERIHYNPAARFHRAQPAISPVSAFFDEAGSQQLVFSASSFT